MSKKTWAESLHKLATGLAALPLAAGILFAAEVHADQSILVRSQPASSESSATSVASLPSQPTPAASEHVSTSFQPRATEASNSAAADDGTIKLKWRARHPDSFVLGGARRDPNVQQATQLTELNNANPFNDPFEDRTRSVFTSTTKQDPEIGGFRELGQQPDAANGNNREQPSFRRPPPGESLVSPSRSGCTDCPDKCYHDRNCCDELAKCATAQQLIREYNIKKISLDISPSIKPDAVSPEDLDEYKSQQLFQASSRTWRDADGNVLAEGSLVDYTNDRVYIASSDGDTKKYAFNMLSDDDRCFVAAWWNIPAACKLGNEKFAGRNHMPVTMTWTASQVCHKPLYFEEIALERYGHTTGPLIQPWISGAHFFKNIAFLPYHMGINPMGECQYDLGYYRPGNCAPWLLNPIPLSARGALFEAGAITGVSYLIP